MLVVTGPIGAGKTTVARALAARTGAEHLSSDELRPRRGHGFGRMARALDAAMREGRRVVLDSTGMSFRFRALVERVRSHACHVHLVVSPDAWLGRERARTDRPPLAEGIYRRSGAVAFATAPDLVIDTTALSADEVTARVVRCWTSMSP